MQKAIASLLKLSATNGAASESRPAGEGEAAFRPRNGMRGLRRTLPVDEAAAIVGDPSLQHALQLPVALWRREQLVVLMAADDVQFDLMIRRPLKGIGVIAKMMRTLA
jgi:hypothetical protein